MLKKALFAMPLALCALPPAAIARGVSPYLPLHLEPEIERQIERVLVLADQPVMSRPIAAARVLDALPKACERDQALCDEVRRYLGRYMHSHDITHASAEYASTSGMRAVPNAHGLDVSSTWQVSAQAYWQPSDYLLLNLGGIAYTNDAVPTGSVLSVGWAKAQLDIGYRDHWLSPLTDSSMLISTEAATMPSVTLSNYQPLTRLGLQYEFFIAEMSNSDRISFADETISGKPRIGGARVTIEPVSGWSLGVNRILQYGGGERPSSLTDLLRAFVSPSRYDNVGDTVTTDSQFGNQLASITSSFLFPGKTPFSVYFEYAGEDTSRGKNYLLGNSALSGGIHFPRLFRRFDLTYEFSEWQNGWYVNGVYGDGLTNDGLVIGHWGGDQRVFGDAVGAQSHMIRIGWDSSFGGAFDLRLRTITNESYGASVYERGQDATLRYSYPFKQIRVGAEALIGKDVFGEDLSRYSVFVRYTPDQRFHSSWTDDTPPARVENDSAEWFIDAGVNGYQVKTDLDSTLPPTTGDTQTGYHVGIGARRSVSERQDLGVRVELDDIDGDTLLAVRALDYRFRFGRHLAAGAFLGAARYDVAAPAYGLYIGLGVQWRDVLKGWDLGLDARYAADVARDDLFPTDPAGNRPDIFYDIQSATLSLSRRF